MQNAPSVDLQIVEEGQRLSFKLVEPIHDLSLLLMDGGNAAAPDPLHFRYVEEGFGAALKHFSLLDQCFQE